MKLEFNKNEILSNLKDDEVKNFLRLSFSDKNIITISDVIDSEMSLVGKTNFIYLFCDLSIEERKDLALKLVRIVLPIFEKAHPDDKTARSCLELAEMFRYNEEDCLDQLKSARCDITKSAHNSWLSCRPYQDVENKLDNKIDFIKKEISKHSNPNRVKKLIDKLICNELNKHRTRVKINLLYYAATVGHAIKVASNPNGEEIDGHNNKPCVYVASMHSADVAKRYNLNNEFLSTIKTFLKK